MASINTLRQSSRQTATQAIGIFKTVQRPVTMQARQTIQTKPFRRHASTSSNPPTTHYHIPKRAAHIGVPLVAFIYLLLRITDPQAPEKTISDPQAGPCTRIHASDLNKYIKSHPDSLSDEHTLGWNKMYNAFKEHRRNQSEPARIEEKNARLLAQYARVEDNKYRSTKVPGVMATEGGNRNIMHRPELMDEAEGGAMSFSERISARLEEAKRRFTKVTKGRDFS